MDRYIPLVISEGDPFTRGFHLGRSETERVIHTITAYMEIFAQTSDLNREAVLTHANHCLSPDLFIHDSNAQEYPETLARGERARSLASERKIDEYFLHSILADHETSPGSICLHVESGIPLIENFESIASIIFDLTAGTVDIAEGPPCENAYRRLSLADCLRVTSYRQTGY